MKLGPLIDILEDPNIVKTGVAIKDDVYNLKKIEEFSPAGFEDLAPLAQSLKIEQTGLRNLTAIFFSPKDFLSLPNFRTGKKARSVHLSKYTQPLMPGLAGNCI